MVGTVRILPHFPGVSLLGTGLCLSALRGPGLCIRGAGINYASAGARGMRESCR